VILGLDTDQGSIVIKKEGNK